jgi:hypothetical protein
MASRNNSTLGPVANEAVMRKVRERQWMYLGPIAAAPIVHISVTMYRGAKTPQMKKLWLWGGIVGCTVSTISMRLFLMWHAGYPGGENTFASDRIKEVTEAQKKEIENPSLAKVASDAFKGFG